MPLTTGQSLSFYEILGPLGAGGMGEVYRAKDTRLEREVAIKVLPDELADDEERLRRFEREAKTLASLNHTNVAGIHGVDQEGDVCFLALELVPGEDLATRLARGPLPVDEAIVVCCQIAEGLEVAHEAGVVHRDLKPANVRITPDGVVKILDFGLAKPIRPKSGTEGTSTSESDSFLMTEEGLVLGTPTYMSPEQARGKPVDRRTDIWAFGCVLFECLTGQRAFRGESFTDVLAAIVGDQPDWSKLPDLPARVSELLARTLTKDPRERLRDIGEARMQLALATSGSDVARAGPVRSRGPGNAIRGTALVLAGAAVGFALAQLTAKPDVGVSENALPTEERGLNVVLHTFETGEVFKDLAISPTARHVAWSDDVGLHVRALDELESKLVHEAKIGSFGWSPEGEALAFSVDDVLFRVKVDDGRTILIARHDDDIADSVWGEDEVHFLTEEGVYSVHEDGGAVELRASFSENSHLHGFGLHRDGIIGVVHPLDGDADRISSYEDGVWTPIFQVPESYLSLLAARPNGSLLYSNSNGPDSVWVLLTAEGREGGFDEPVLLPVGSRRVSVANDGTIAYLLEEKEPLGEEEKASWGQPRWFHFDGSITPITEEDSRVNSVQFSPDQSQILFSSFEGMGLNLRVHDIERGLTTPLLSYDQLAVGRYLPDGRVAVSRVMKNQGTLAYAPSGKGDPEPLSDMILMGVSDDSSTWVWSDRFMGGDLMWSADQHATDLRTLLGADEEAVFLDFSPDGAWMLYTTERTGDPQVYLTRFPPDENEEWPVSGPGFKQAWFLEDQSAILFVGEEERSVSRASFETRPEVRLGTPEPVFELERGAQLLDFDGVDRFLGTTTKPPGVRHIVISTEWRELLR